MKAALIHVETHRPDLSVPRGLPRREPAPKANPLPARAAKAAQPYLDRVGPLRWAELHHRALHNPAGVDDSVWLAAFSRTLPCGDCSLHWLQMMGRTPPDWANYFAWTVARHNEVNARLKKPLPTIEEALARWS